MKLAARNASIVIALSVAACSSRLDTPCNTDADCTGAVCEGGICRVPVASDEALADRADRADGEDADEPGGGNEEVGDAACATSAPAYFDEDGDGHTGRVEARCVDEELPTAASWEPRYAPVHLLEPTEPEVQQGLWVNGASTFFRTNSAPVGELSISGFACAAALERVTGLELVVAIDSAAAPVTEVRIAIEVNGVVSEERAASIVADDAQVALGGPTDTFGIEVSPTQLCDPSFTVHLTVAPESGNGSGLEVRTATVLAYGAADCNDDDPLAFSPAELRGDADLDGWAGGLRVPACIGLVVPVGRAVRELDCAPDDAAAFPGQTQRFGRPRLGVGGFDFDCDDDEEPLDNTIEDMSSCVLSGDGTSCQVWFSPVTPSCGETITYGDCLGTCQLRTEQFTQLCR